MNTAQPTRVQKSNRLLTQVSKESDFTMRKPVQILARRSSFRRLWSDNRGVSTVEYVIILVLIAVLGIGAWKTFGKSVSDKIIGADKTFNEKVQ